MVTRRRSFIITGPAQRTVRFLVALALLVYEAVWYQGDVVRWHLIVLYGTMLGLPLAELGDEIRRRGSQEPPDDET